MSFEQHWEALTQQDVNKDIKVEALKGCLDYLQFYHVLLSDLLCLIM